MKKSTLKILTSIYIIFIIALIFTNLKDIQTGLGDDVANQGYYASLILFIVIPSALLIYAWKKQNVPFVR